MPTQKGSAITIGKTQSIISVKPNEKNCSIARIEDFFITTDSIVAKATIITNGETRSLEINWGDGEQDTLSSTDLQRIVPQPINPDPLPPGTYELYHKYGVSYREIGEQTYPKAKEYTVTLFTRDANGELDFKLNQITITPKYKINFYRLYVGNKNECDNGTSLNEFTTVQTVGGEIRNTWDWTSSDNFFFQNPAHGFDGSQLTQVYEVTDLNPFSQPVIDSVWFKFTEHDWRYDEKGSLSYPTSLSSYLTDMEEDASGRLEGEIYMSDSSFFGFSCTLMYVVDWEIKLLAPIPTYTSPLVIV